MSQTLILIQFTEDENSRTYLDFDTFTQGMDGFLNLYEEKLRKMNPQLSSISYDLLELTNYIDSLRDISCFVFNEKAKIYSPHGRDWIKSQLYEYVRNQTAG